MNALSLTPLHFADAVHAALLEDVGPGDVTTESCIPIGTKSSAIMIAKSPGAIAGLNIAAYAFRQLDPDLLWEALISDGAVVDGNRTILARISGDARAILTAERVALNFVQHLSGIATATHNAVKKVEGTSARIVDTRKTTPGLRTLEKYAVRAGGGHNHRLGLYDAVIIKDNHIRAASGIANAVASARQRIPHTMKIEVEAATLVEVDEALDAGADIILLDNMDAAMMRTAVLRVAGRAITEASGGLTQDRIPEVAATGVDILSIGALTHSSPAMDISLEFLS